MYCPGAVKAVMSLSNSTMTVRCSAASRRDCRRTAMLSTHSDRLTTNAFAICSRNHSPNWMSDSESSGGDGSVMSGAKASPPPKGDDIAVGVLDVEVLRAPRGRRQRLDDLCAVRDAPGVERLDAVHAGRGVQMLLIASVLALGAVLGRLLEVKLEPIQLTNRVEPLPRLAKREAEFLVVRNCTGKIIHKKLGSEGGEPRLCLHTENLPLSRDASVAGKVIEHAKQVAVQVRDCEFMQVSSIHTRGCATDWLTQLTIVNPALGLPCNDSSRHSRS